MFVRKVQSGPRNYLRIVEGYRDKKTGMVCQCTVANLFRTLKSDLLIKPIHHRLLEQINGHTAICFLALFINRFMRSLLRANGTFQSPTEILRIMKYIKLMSTQVNGERFMGISQRTEEQLELFDKLEVAPPK